MSKQSDLVSVSQGASGDPLFIDTVNDRVGIGTSSPNLNTIGTVLHVNNGNVAHAALTRYTTGDTGSAATDGFDVGMWSDGDAFVWMRESANMRFATAGTERMRIDTAGRVTMPNQARCVVTQDGGWRTLTAGTSYGVSSGGFPVNNGGFYNGGQINGFNVVHVPVSGWYRFDMYTYSGNGCPAGARFILMKNNSEEMTFVQTPSTTDCTTLMSKMFYMTANDYVNYKVAPPGFPNFTAYFADNHTMLAISLEG